MSKFSFRKLATQDFGLLHRWLIQPYVAKWWNPPKTFGDTVNRYQKHQNAEHIDLFIVYHEDEPLGFIQSYEVAKVGNGWWEDQPEGTWGIIHLVGEPERLQKGLGSEFLTQFTDELLAKPEVNQVITDPNPENKVAIRSCEKAGFKMVGEINTPDGPACLMVKN